jgi:hypothetical protein
MRTQAFDAITRRAATGVSRRGSLLTLGGAALAATLAGPQLGVAKKKKGKDCKKKEKQRCNNDIAACRSTVLINCEEPDGCPEALLCCEDCSASGLLACIIAAQDMS